MPSSQDQAPTAVARILYKEIVDGDLRKFRAESNDTDSGGGARDLRFGDYQAIEPIIMKIFPERLEVDRVRNRTKARVEIFAGTFYWDSSGTVRSKRVEFEPPTTARPREGRLTRVHQQPSLDPSKLLPLKVNDKVILLFVQRNDGAVWPSFTTQTSLMKPGEWDDRVAKEILKCVDRKRGGDTVVIGYRDFTTAEGYCNGR